MPINSPNPTVSTEPTNQPTSFWRRAFWLGLAGFVGLLSLLLQPVPAALLEKAPELAALPPLALKAAMLINPLVLLIAATLLGAALAHQVGLRSLLAGTAQSHAWPRSLARAAVLGLLLGCLLAALDHALTPQLGAAWQNLVANAPPSASSLVLGLLYGGITEEVLLRWGLMSLLAWCLLKLLGQSRQKLALAGAIFIAALLFGAGHLPVVALQIELTPLLIARTLLLNMIAGVLYGWLFMRYHLEAAMAAHAATHLGMLAVRLLLGN
jgi:membrane protease YdiL (CAAX protease family)